MSDPTPSRGDAAATHDADAEPEHGQAALGHATPPLGHATHPAKRRSFARKWTWLFVLAAIAAYAITYVPARSHIDWRPSFDAAAAEAAQTHRPILLQFTSEYCPQCFLMDRHVLNKGEVLAALSATVPVRVDAPANVDLARRFGINGLPGFVLLDPAGNLLARREGFQTPEQFIKFLGYAEPAR